jgi:hypothetical protein
LLKLQEKFDQRSWPLRTVYTFAVSERLAGATVRGVRGGVHAEATRRARLFRHLQTSRLSPPLEINRDVTGPKDRAP